MNTTLSSAPAVIPGAARDLQAPDPRFARDDRPVVERVLRVPLLVKLLGANMVIVAAALAGHNYLPWSSAAEALALALALSFVVTAVLTWLALRPVTQLEATAARVSRGDFRARVPASMLADRDIQALSATMNRLLDRVEADRQRIEHLAGRSVRARDLERASVARELRDSLAQLVSAIGLQLSALQAITGDEAKRHIEGTRALLTQLGDEMGAIAETLHPGTLVELGLPNAVSMLVRRSSRNTSLRVQLDAGDFAGTPTPAVASALYRVADEALRNVVEHAGAEHARVTLRSEKGGIVLEVEDDGRGMDFRHADPVQSGLGLFSARAVLALAGGELQIHSAPERGTLVRAAVPPHRENGP